MRSRTVTALQPLGIYNTSLRNKRKYHNNLRALIALYRISHAVATASRQNPASRQRDRTAYIAGRGITGYRMCVVVRVCVHVCVGGEGGESVVCAVHVRMCAYMRVHLY